MADSIRIVRDRSVELEQALWALGAEGKGLGEKYRSLGDRLSREVRAELQRLNRTRNEVMHENLELNDEQLASFKDNADRVLVTLQALRTPEWTADPVRPHEPGARTGRDRHMNVSAASQAPKPPRLAPPAPPRVRTGPATLGDDYADLLHAFQSGEVYRPHKPPPPDRADVAAFAPAAAPRAARQRLNLPDFGLTWWQKLWMGAVGLYALSMIWLVGVLTHQEAFAVFVTHLLRFPWLLNIIVGIGRVLSTIALGGTGLILIVLLIMWRSR